MLNLVIDIGNTRTKYAVFDQKKIIDDWNEQNFSVQSVKQKLKKIPSIKNVVLSSVIKTKKTDLKFLKKQFYFIELSRATLLPLKNCYATPETLGIDRLANAAGAASLFPKKNSLIIDLGTCIKFDFIDKNKIYHGGAISPGLEMRFNALHHFTAKLPLVKSSQKFLLVGNNSTHSILSGVQNGIIFELNGAIQAYKKKYNNLKVILTGGDSSFFANHLKNPIFAAPNLTLQGLNEILLYNVLKRF